MWGVKIRKAAAIAAVLSLYQATAWGSSTSSYDVVIDTSPLVGHPAGPFSIFLGFTDGSGIGSMRASITVTNVNFGGGSLVGESPMIFGAASGDLMTGVEITDASFLSLFSQGFTAGNTLRFTVSLNTAGDDSEIPDRLSFYILDSSARPIPTLAPAGDFLFAIDVRPAGGSPEVFGSDPSRGSPPIEPPQITLLDTTPPITTATPRPTPNTNGWNNTDVTATLVSTDNEPGGTGVKEIHFSLTGAQVGSGVASGGIASVPISAEGVTTLTYFAVDNAGNQEAARALTVQVDKTPPVVMWATPSPAANAAGWNNTDVTISFTVNDGLSGINNVTQSSPLLLTTEGAAVVGTVTVTDKAGNSATYTSPAVKIDKTPPTIVCRATPGVLWPPDHKMTTIDVLASVSDSLSGSAGSVLTSITSNEPFTTEDIQGFTVGSAATTGQLRAERLGGGTGRIYTLSYTGADTAGNIASCSTTVTVPHDQRADR